MKRIFVITLVLVLGIVLIGCSDSEEPEEVPEEGKEDIIKDVELTDQYSIKEEVEVISSGGAESSLTYPLVEGLIEKDVENKVNDRIIDRMGRFKESIENMEEISGEADDYLVVTYDAKHKSKEMLSIRFGVNAYMAAFGEEDSTIISKTFDLRTGNVLGIEDILEGNFESELNSILSQKFSELDVELINEFKGIEEGQEFYLKDDNLVIYYNTLEYTTQEDGSLEFEIPFSEIDGILKAPLVLERINSPELDNYNIAINEDTKPFEALFFIGENIKKASLEDATTMILSFEEIQDKYIGIYEEMLIDNEIQQKLFDAFGNKFNREKVEKINDVNLVSLLTEIIDGGYMIINLEGLFTVVKDYSVLEEYSEYLTDDIKDYIALKVDESESFKGLKTGQNLSWEQVKDRIISYEKYIETHPDSLKEYVISNEHMYFWHSYIFGFDGMPAFNYSTNKINDELIQSYREFVVENEKSETAKIIEDYLEVLEKNNYRLSEEIDEYRRSFASINENYF
ncbi:DUF3298 domain-containing protein [Herbivorax sp. ANBcel31]|uniref:RsiV family protein n=1 Tax=Herbivorax sp. ANBcel31 TaxID=3069754 RepID=UPI0027B62FF6|nr:DUF3298 domain-containing protein [Herbivorax sp. ANBcel31]MDQ2086065.1 DUF3298 domain-containing protein [Herbivorax sp. ANBcel31]